MKMENQQPKSTQKNLDERGFAAIVIAIVLVTVLSLITIGFAKLMRNEQNNALNRELSNAAYYAAESGINDAAKALSLDPTITKSACAALPAGTPGAGQYLTNNVTQGTAASPIASYPCLLIDPTPNDVRFNPVGDDDDNSKTFVMYGNSVSSPLPFNTVTIKWQNTDGSRVPASKAPGVFQTVSNWGSTTGVMRVELVPITGSPISRSSLITGAFSDFAYPVNGGGGTVSFASAAGISQGIVTSGNCAAANSPYCSLTISGLSAPMYLVRLDSIYNPSTVVMTATGTGAYTSGMPIAGVQTLVDSTGNSQGVLRRVQVRIPTAEYDLPQYDLEATSGICKLVNAEPSGNPAYNTDACR